MSDLHIVDWSGGCLLDLLTVCAPMSLVVLEEFPALKATTFSLTLVIPATAKVPGIVVSLTPDRVSGSISQTSGTSARVAISFPDSRDTRSLKYAPSWSSWNTVLTENVWDAMAELDAAGIMAKSRVEMRLKGQIGTISPLVKGSADEIWLHVYCSSGLDYDIGAGPWCSLDVFIFKYGIHYAFPCAFSTNCLPLQSPV